MTKKLHLCILWHMHQPYYKDDADGAYHLPWTYLHGIKDYFELPAYHKKFDRIKATFNLVPSLTMQIEDYCNTDINDRFLNILRKKVVELSEDEKSELVPQLFMANVQNMIRPFSRYMELYNKGKHRNMFESPQSVFTDGEILELEVLYLLAWCGEFTRAEVPAVQSLINQGSDFTEEQKTDLLDRLAEFTAKILPLYKELMDNGRIEVSTTPFYHPILPLLINLDSAKEAYPDIPMPTAYCGFEDDAEYHVSEAVKSYEKLFGRKPEGMWPAEGSISLDAAYMFSKHGAKWIASDEDVLSGSIRKDLTADENRHELYKKHFFVAGGKRIYIFFRDKMLSDLIGFTYSGWQAEKAADDFISKLKKIYDSSKDDTMVPVILDGENAWEYYAENGRPFFEALYKRLSDADWIVTETMAEAVDNGQIPEKEIANIRAGSWIYGNFTTWIGSREKNEAWKHLTSARNMLSRIEDKKKLKSAMQELYIAEGSDWFWWFGDDHFSLQSDTFDRLFRKHLINFYTAGGLTVPSELYIPIKKTHKTGLVRRANYFITPRIDGEVSSFYEWLSAGEFDLKFDSGAMHASSSIMQGLSFGHDKDNVYLKIDGEVRSVLDRGYTLYVEAVSTDKSEFAIPLTSEIYEADGVKCACAKVIEIQLSKKKIFKEAEGRLYLVFRIKKDDTVLERAPLYNFVEIDTSEDYDLDWMV